MNMRNFNPSDYTILIIDEDIEFSNSCIIVLEKEGYHTIICTKENEVIEKLNKNKIYIVLIDCLFPNLDEIISFIKKSNPNIQIILQTEHNVAAAEWDRFQKLDIQGYYDKNDGLEKILIWINMAAKFYHHFSILEKSKEGLRYILKITPQIYKMQSLQDLLKGTILQLISLMDGENGFLSTLDFNTMSMQTKKDLFEYQVGIGTFTNKNCLNVLTGSQKKIIQGAIEERQIKNKDNIIVIPIVLRDKILGIIYIESYRNIHEDMELLLIFANQIAIAIENTVLYELATIDSLTKLYVKGYFSQRLKEEMRSSHRYNYPLLIIFLDVDHFKKINDTYGHQFGDFALAEVAQIIKNSIRETDIGCRYGGDEFAVILPHTNQQGGKILAERILQRINEKAYNSPSGEKIHISISLGLACINFNINEAAKYIRKNTFFEEVAHRFVEAADKALYEAKNSGRNRICESDQIIIL
ncbi:diguanylate cyclase [Candidatus Poribacteria bacterium]|nr:diguanylate cyclase [Candidatus Poribacteria bacterium]